MNEDSSAELYKISTSGYADDAMSVPRSILDENVDYRLSERLLQGEPLGALPYPIRARQRSRGPLEDMPWSIGSAPIVSDRLKRILEKHAPQHGEYWPVEIYGRHADTGGMNYWLVNWLRVVDCFDRSASDYDIVQDHAGDSRYRFRKLVITEAAVPRRAKLFRVLHFPEIQIVRRNLLMTIAAAGITGYQTYPIEYV
jgi:hypothetical protein